MPDGDVLRPPLLTHDLPGVGGRVKELPEDFEVEEIPAYSPSGEGDFLYLWVEKRDLGAEYFQRQVAQRLGIPAGEIGTAGLKDRRAVTRQFVSVPAHVESRLGQLDGDGIRVLSVGRHANKLRPGHLHGNHFNILIRALDPAHSRPEVLTAILDRLRIGGLPNYYGTQRFGHDGETLDLGLRLLRKEQSRARTPFLKKLALSAAQSALFNCYLAQRLRDGLYRRVLPGDVMAKVPFGGMFTAENVAVEQERFDRREIVTAGPIFGRKTFPANADAVVREQATLTAFGLDAWAFEGFGKLVLGTRRHNIVYLDDLVADFEPDGLRLRFSLPAGSYATVLLREIMKSEPNTEPEA